MDTNHNNNINK